MKLMSRTMKLNIFYVTVNATSLNFNSKLDKIHFQRKKVLFKKETFQALFMASLKFDQAFLFFSSPSRNILLLRLLKVLARSRSLELPLRPRTLRIILANIVHFLNDEKEFSPKFCSTFKHT